MALHNYTNAARDTNFAIPFINVVVVVTSNSAVAVDESDFILAPALHSDPPSTQPLTVGGHRGQACSTHCFSSLVNNKMEIGRWTMERTSVRAKGAVIKNMRETAFDDATMGSCSITIELLFGSIWSPASSYDNNYLGNSIMTHSDGGKSHYFNLCAQVNEY